MTVDFPLITSTDHTLRSHDLTLGSLGHTLGSHDFTLGSHDLTSGSHDLTLGSHDLYFTKEKELTFLQGVTGNRLLEQTLLLSLSLTFLSPPPIGENSGRSSHTVGRTIEDMAGLSPPRSPYRQRPVAVGWLWMMAGE